MNNEYQDQSVWFEVWEFDGVAWDYVADFDTREDAEAFAAGRCEAWETRIKRVAGLA